MELTSQSISKWFDLYFEDVRKSQGALETVPALRKYFAPDLELTMYTAPPPTSRNSMSRDALLLSFVHPGLREDILPRYYVIDVQQMIVAVQFEIRFYDEPSGQKWDPIQASAHYHLMVDETSDIKISRICYWTEPLPQDLFAFWAKHRDEALSRHALEYINNASAR
jgi:hypothetical protein